MATGWVFATAMDNRPPGSPTVTAVWHSLVDADRARPASIPPDGEWGQQSTGAATT